MGLSPIAAIDAVVNLWTEEALAARPAWRDAFFGDKMRVQRETVRGVSLGAMLARMDAAGIERALLIATKAGRLGHPSTYHLPYALVADAVQRHPHRFSALAGIDPTEGMKGVRALETAVREDGFVGAHFYPHWFEMAPDHARLYPFYAKCCELDVPIQMQVGQSMLYAPDYPCRSTGRPIALDGVACDFPELVLIGIHIGIPWHDEMIAMAWKHPNIFIGTDAHSPRYWPASFVQFANTYGRNKVLFGTDFPVLDFERTMRELLELGLKPETLQAMLRDNAARLYRL